MTFGNIRTRPTGRSPRAPPGARRRAVSSPAARARGRSRSPRHASYGRRSLLPSRGLGDEPAASGTSPSAARPIRRPRRLPVKASVPSRRRSGQARQPTPRASSTARRRGAISTSATAAAPVRRRHRLHRAPRRSRCGRRQLPLGEPQGATPGWGSSPARGRDRTPPRRRRRSPRRPADLGQLQERRRRDSRLDDHQLVAGALGLRLGLAATRRVGAPPRPGSPGTSPGRASPAGSSRTTPPLRRSTRRRVAGRRSPGTPSRLQWMHPRRSTARPRRRWWRPSPRPAARGPPDAAGYRSTRRPRVWIAIAISSGSRSSRPIGTSRRSGRAYRRDRRCSTRRSPRACARNPCSRPGASSAACRPARIRNPLPTAGSPRMKCSIASRAAVQPAEASFPRRRRPRTRPCGSAAPRELRAPPGRVREGLEVGPGHGRAVRLTERGVRGGPVLASHRLAGPTDRGVRRRYPLAVRASVSLEDRVVHRSRRPLDAHAPDARLTTAMVKGQRRSRTLRSGVEQRRWDHEGGGIRDGFACTSNGRSGGHGRDRGDEPRDPEAGPRHVSGDHGPHRLRGVRAVARTRADLHDATRMGATG